MYHMYRLAKWLDMPSPTDVKSQVDTTPIPSVSQGDETSQTEGVGLKEGTMTTEKRKTKQEEYLLIPSSSSSSSGSEKGNDDILEDVSEDDGLEVISEDEENENMVNKEADQDSELSAGFSVKLSLDETNKEIKK